MSVKCHFQESKANCSFPRFDENIYTCSPGWYRSITLKEIIHTVSICSSDSTSYKLHLLEEPEMNMNSLNWSYLFIPILSQLGDILNSNNKNDTPSSSSSFSFLLLLPPLFPVRVSCNPGYVFKDAFRCLIPLPPLLKCWDLQVWSAV